MRCSTEDASSSCWGVLVPSHRLRWPPHPSDDCAIRLWNPATGGGLFRELWGHNKLIRSTAFSHDQMMQVWDMTASAPHRHLEGHRNLVQPSYFPQAVPSGLHLFRLPRPHLGRVFRRFYRVIEGYTDPVTSVAFSPVT